MTIHAGGKSTCRREIMNLLAWNSSVLNNHIYSVAIFVITACMCMLIL